ncbi:MAG: hypothetical protein J7513_04145 [Solirubrobacteraceae bacterium]|nr:hypothetical protein [Solirubrobacteraceae bacterium]
MIARRGPLALLLAAGLLSPLAVGTGQAAAPGKVKVGVDQATNVSFSVTGRMIDVRLRPSGDGVPNPLVQQLSNASIAVACRGRSPKHGRYVVGEIETSWPKDSDLMRTRLSRDGSARMQWCVLEQIDGTDIAVTRKMRTPKPVAPDAPASATP